MSKECQIGDKVQCKGQIIEIAEIISQDFKDNGSESGWFIEFKDPEGDYHYWKQYVDGGCLIPGNREIAKAEQYICYVVEAKSDKVKLYFPYEKPDRVTTKNYTIDILRDVLGLTFNSDYFECFDPTEPFILSVNDDSFTLQVLTESKCEREQVVCLLDNRLLLTNKGRLCKLFSRRHSMKRAAYPLSLSAYYDTVMSFEDCGYTGMDVLLYKGKMVAFEWSRVPRERDTSFDLYLKQLSMLGENRMRDLLAIPDKGTGIQTMSSF